MTRTTQTPEAAVLPTSSRRVLVLGASGFVGARLTARLVADGLPVRALSRGSAAPAGAEAFTGDATDTTALGRALEGCAAVCVCVPWQQEPQVARALVEAARVAGRPDLHVLTVSGITVVRENAGAPLVDAKLAATATYRASGLPLTVLKPSWFMDALSLFVRDGRATLFGRQPRPWNLVALEDFAALVSAELRRAPVGVRELVVEGPEAARLDEALARYVAVAHPGVTSSVMPLWFGRLLAFFVRSPALADLVGMMAFFSTVAHQAQGTTVRTGTGFTTWLGASSAAGRAPAPHAMGGVVVASGGH